MASAAALSQPRRLALGHSAANQVVIAPKKKAACEAQEEREGVERGSKGAEMDVFSSQNWAKVPQKTPAPWRGERLTTTWCSVVHRSAQVWCTGVHRVRRWCAGLVRRCAPVRTGCSGFCAQVCTGPILDRCGRT